MTRSQKLKILLIAPNKDAIVKVRIPPEVLSDPVPLLRSLSVPISKPIPKATAKLSQRMLFTIIGNGFTKAQHS